MKVNGFRRICECDSCDEGLCIYSAVATVTSIETVGFTSINNASLSAIKANVRIGWGYVVSRISRLKEISRIPNGTNLIFHSDQGWQYQMESYQYRLREKGIRQSMYRKGNCLDNSVMENFFGIIKSEMFYEREWAFKTLDELRKEIVEYIDYYNNKRIKSNLKGLSPVQYRTQSQEVA